MNNFIKFGAVTGLAALAATPAFAHPGPHNFGFVGNTIHFLSQPDHALFAVLGSLAVIVIARKLRTSKN